jgi:hypothetical protein
MWQGEKKAEAGHFLQAAISSLLYTFMLYYIVLTWEIWVKYSQGEEGKVARVLMARLWSQQFPTIHRIVWVYSAASSFGDYCNMQDTFVY